MSAAPTFSEVRFRAMRERLAIVAMVLMADDRLRLVSFGPRGGWRYTP